MNLIELHGGTFTLKIQGPHRHRVDCHLPAGARDGGAAAVVGARAADPAAQEPESNGRKSKRSLLTRCGAERFSLAAIAFGSAVLI